MTNLLSRIGVIFFLTLFVNVSLLSAGETNGGDLGLFDMSLEQLMMLEIKVDVASFFTEDDLISGSSVYRIDSEKWEYQGARRIHEALENEVGVLSYMTTGGAVATSVRGYTKKKMQGIAYLIDGIPINDTSRGAAIYHVPNWELGTLKKIEMIKGPGSALYGSDAFHGVIALNTFESQKDVVEISGAGATSTYGQGSVRLSRGVFGNMGRINMAVAKSAQGDQSLSYEYEDGNGEYKDEYDSQTSVLKMSLSPNDRLKVKVGAYLSDWNSEDFPGLSHLDAYDFSGSDTDFKMGRILASYVLGNNISLETDLYAFKSDYEASNIISAAPLSKILQQEENTRANASVMLKQQDNDLHLQWAVGYSYTEAKTRDTHFEIVDEVDLGELPFDGFSRDIQSVIAQAKWGVSDERVYLLLGGRYDEYSDFGNQFSPRGGVIFLPTEKSSVKALYGRAFNAPAGADLHGQELVIYGNDTLKPETIDVYELIYMCKGKNYMFNVTSFYSFWKNAIIIEPADNLPSGFTHRYVNKGRNRAYGLETTIDYAVRSFVFELGGSYVKSESLDIENPLSPGETSDQEYDTFPTYAILFGIFYHLKPLSLDFNLNNRIYLGMKEAPREENPDPEDLDPYWRVDLNVKKKFTRRINVILNIRNLLDRNNYLPSVWGADGGYLEPGISAMVSVNLTF